LALTLVTAPVLAMEKAMAILIAAVTGKISKVNKMKFLCEGNWDLINEQKDKRIGIMRFSFMKKSKVFITFNKGYISVFLISNNLFSRLFRMPMDGLNSKKLHFLRTR
jgi:hypothetical protein